VTNQNICIRYIIHKFMTKVTIKEATKRMHYPGICKEIANYAFSKKCCSVNCIYNRVETHNIIQVAKAIQKARANGYHTNANFAHEELRYLLKTDRCRYTREIFAYFDHMRVLKATTKTPLKIKVSRRDCTGLYGRYFFV